MPTKRKSKSKSRRRSSSKPWLLGLLIGTPVLILLVVVGVWIFGSSSLDTQLAALRADGQPVTAAEINDYYIVPEGATDTTVLWVAAIDGVTAANISATGKSLPFIGIDGKTPVPPLGEEWDKLDESRTLITGLDTEMQAIYRAAAAGGQARYPVNFSAGIATLLPRTQESRQVARLLSLDAHVAAHDGDSARALQDIKAIFALSDSLRGEPCLISQLVRIAIHAVGRSQVEELMPHCDWSDAELQSLQAAIGSAEFKQEFSNCMSGERAISLTALDSMSLGPFRKSNKLEALKFFERSINGLSKTWPDALQQHREIGAELKKLNKAGTLTRMRLSGVLMLLPAMDVAVIAGARANAGQKTTIIAIAAQRHRLKHGQLPTSLAEIDPALLGKSASALLIDPFNGKKLLFKSEDSQIIIYSVGKNEKDDGGAVDATPQGQLLDVGFKLKR